MNTTKETIHMPKIVDRTEFLSAVGRMFGNIAQITRTDVLRVCEKYAVDYPNWLTANPEYRAGRGTYDLSSFDIPVPEGKTFAKPAAKAETSPIAQAAMAGQVVALPVTSQVPADSYVPPKASGYVPFGHFNDVRSIIKSMRFYPVYITGLSGNGKTMMVEQVCALEKRECIRVNITIETDEDDLIGGFRLVDGATVWQNGPVVVAMEKGAILLLDEVDLGSNKLMCLQPVLEGKPIFLKKINKKIFPKAGFNVIATANTKGKGSDDGRFVGTNVMNEAFLERFSITMEQEYPPSKTELKILKNVLDAAQASDDDFAEKLVNWADVVRKAFMEQAITEILSTRRLVHICEAFGIFDRNRDKAIELCLNRFDADTKTAFMQLYAKLDETNAPADPMATAKPSSDEEIEF
jgi:hypothetical protein